MAVPTARLLCLSLLALFASSCSEEPCQGLKCYQFPPCGQDRNCGWTGLGFETLSAPMSPRTGEIIRVGGDILSRDYALKTEVGRVYTFSCTAEGFESCQVKLTDLERNAVFIEQEGRTTHVHFRSFSEDGAAAYVSALPAGSTGAFQYAFTERTDDHAPDAARATLLTLGAPALPGLLQAGPDTDTFAFDVPGRHSFLVRCDGAFRTTPTNTFKVFAPDGTSADSILRDRGWEHVGLATPSGRYVLQLTGTALSAALPYACSVEDLGVDDHGDSMDTATVLPEGASVPLTGAIQRLYEWDDFRFTARAGHAYALRCDTPDFAPCLDARILDAQRLELPVPVGVGSDTQLRVSVKGQGALGTYALTLLDLGPDQGSGAQDAVSVLGDVSVVGYLTPSGDEDYFRFDAQAGHVYSVQAEGASVEAVLFAAPAQSLTRYDVAPVRRFLVDTDATVLLRISGPQTRYRLSVKDVGVDDHAGTPGAATDVGGALSVSGMLDASTDVDWFALALEARPYAPRVTSRDTKFLLFEADGVTPVPWDTARGAWVPRTAGRHLVRADVFGTFPAPDAYALELLPR